MRRSTRRRATATGLGAAPGDAERRDDHRARPRVRGLTEQFETPVLPLFKRRTETVGAPFPRFYLHGLAKGD